MILIIINEHVTLTYKNNRNMSVSLEPFGTYCLKHCDEFLTSNINYEPQSGIDGGTYISDRLEPRDINISGVIICKAFENHSLMQQLSRVFNPKFDGVLTYYNKLTNETRTIDCKPTKAIESGIFSNRSSFNIELKALDPYWKGKQVTEIIAETIKLGHFPLIITKDFMFGKRMKALQSTFENIGDADIGFTVELFAQFGTVLNPVVSNGDTEEKIRIEYAMEKGDAIKIINYPNRKDIILNNKESIFHTIEPDEVDFFTLHAGTNTICYGADENHTNLRVILRYAPNYIGVG